MSAAAEGGSFPAAYLPLAGGSRGERKTCPCGRQYAAFPARRLSDFFQKAAAENSRQRPGGINEEKYNKEIKHDYKCSGRFFERH